MVTSKTCGAQEWIVAGENGWVVDALDVVHLAAALNELVALGGQLPARTAARAAVHSLTLDAMAGRLQALYRQAGMLPDGRV